MTNIAMLSYHTCPLATLGGKDTGGMNVYVHELTTHLGRLGVHVDVFTRSQDDHVPHILHDLGCGNRVVHIPAGPELPQRKNVLPGYLDDFTRGIMDFAQGKNIRYDLIHAHYWMSGMAGLKLREEWHAPLVQMFHTLGEVKNRVSRNLDDHESPHRIPTEDLLINSVDCLIISTPAEQDHIQSLYTKPPRRIEIIPPGVDLSRFYPIPVDEARAFIGAPTSKCMLLFVGRIEPLKGIDTLIQAIAILAREHTTKDCLPILSIIGGDPDMDETSISKEMVRLKTMCAELGVEDLVIFLGKRSQDTLPYYYSAAQVVVVPSQYESFGMVALEAMACGRPVVASRVGGLAYLIQDGVNGYAIIKDDPQQLAQRLNELIFDENLRSRIGSNAQSFSEDFAWEKIAARIASLYSDLL